MANAATELRTGTLFSSDSHVMESPEMWADHLPASFWPDGGGSFQGQPGGHDPEARLEEMGQDGVTAEVLYPTLGLKLFGSDQSKCFLARLFNAIRQQVIENLLGHTPVRVSQLGAVEANLLENVQR